MRRWCVVKVMVRRFRRRWCGGVASEAREGAAVLKVTLVVSVAIDAARTHPPWSGCQSFSTPCAAMLAPIFSSSLCAFHHTYEFDVADQKRTHSGPDGAEPLVATGRGAEVDDAEAPGLEAFLVVAGGGAGAGGVFGAPSGGVSRWLAEGERCGLDAAGSAAGWLGGAEGERVGSERDVDGRPAKRPPPLPTLPPRVRGIEGGPGLGRRELIARYRYLCAAITSGLDVNQALAARSLGLKVGG